jgi:hypothetical protein
VENKSVNSLRDNYKNKNEGIRVDFSEDRAWEESENQRKNFKFKNKNLKWDEVSVQEEASREAFTKLLKYTLAATLVSCSIIIILLNKDDISGAASSTLETIRNLNPTGLHNLWLEFFNNHFRSIPVSNTPNITGFGDAIDITPTASGSVTIHETSIEVDHSSLSDSDEGTIQSSGDETPTNSTVLESPNYEVGSTRDESTSNSSDLPIIQATNSTTNSSPNLNPLNSGSSNNDSLSGRYQLPNNAIPLDSSHGTHLEGIDGDILGELSFYNIPMERAFLIKCLKKLKNSYWKFMDSEGNNLLGKS